MSLNQPWLKPVTCQLDALYQIGEPDFTRTVGGATPGLLSLQFKAVPEADLFKLIPVDALWS